MTKKEQDDLKAASQVLKGQVSDDFWEAFNSIAEKEYPKGYDSTIYTYLDKNKGGFNGDYYTQTPASLLPEKAKVVPAPERDITKCPFFKDLIFGYSKSWVNTERRFVYWGGLDETHPMFKRVKKQKYLVYYDGLDFCMSNKYWIQLTYEEALKRSEYTSLFEWK